jgi:serine/threonine-protein kinase RsbW
MGVGVPETVRLTVPAALEFVRIVRLTASGVASRLGFDVEEIEDLRVAVDELSSIFVEVASPDGELSLAFTSTVDGLEIEGRTAVDGMAPPVVEDLTRQILAAVVDEYDVDCFEGYARFRCTKRLAS